MAKRFLSASAAFFLLLAAACRHNGFDVYHGIPLHSAITRPQPMTGIVYWSDSGRNDTDAIQLEYSYMKYSDVVAEEGVYDWSSVEAILDAAAGRGHQAVLRFYYVYPGFETAVPRYLKESAGYHETEDVSEGQPTWFPDWSFAGLQDFTLAFYSEFAERYGNDPRLAFLQTGFGLWAEYHIYDGPYELGKTFPSKDFQARFFRHLGSCMGSLPWSVSIDAADPERSPLTEDDPELLEIGFGLFDDSFLCRDHDGYNAECFSALGVGQRYALAPVGGEFSYYSDYDQAHALDANGPYGKSFEGEASRFRLSFIIGNDQPDYQSGDRIRRAGMACGYRFRIARFGTTESSSLVRVENSGVAPVYRDAYVAVNGVRSRTSLKGLLPGEGLDLEIASGGRNPVLSVECDHLVAGQRIEFEADLD